MSNKIQFYLRTDRPTKSGSVQVYLLFLKSRTQKLKHATGKFISLKEEYRKLSYEQILKIPMSQRQQLYCWDSQSQRATKGNKNLERLNYYFTSEENKANKIILEHEIKGSTLTPSIFASKFFKAQGNPLLYPYFLNEIEVVRKATWSTNTKKGYKAVINKVNDFRENVLLIDIDFKFLTDFKEYMIAKRGNDDVTVNKDLKRLRTLVKIAIKNKDLSQDDYPFKDFKISEDNPELTNSDVLEQHELPILEEMYDNYVAPKRQYLSPQEWRERKEEGMLSPGEYDLLERFLFSCYTGLRFEDVLRVEKSKHIFEKPVYNHVTSETYLSKYLQLEQGKTENLVVVPLTGKALAILEKKGDKLFNRITNQKANEHLESIQEKSGIKKELTFHVSRHTYGTWLALAGIPEKARQLLMGHKDGKYTRRYTHITNNQLFLEMEKMEIDLAQKFSQKGGNVGVENVREMFPMIKDLTPDLLQKVKDIIKVLSNAAA
ncbi:MAG: site-specific integrase [Bacteroidota bacterium]|nr:site-specific integrase [Bacteroidota bacterium]